MIPTTVTVVSAGFTSTVLNICQNWSQIGLKAPHGTYLRLLNIRFLFILARSRIRMNRKLILISLRFVSCGVNLFRFEAYSDIHVFNHVQKVIYLGMTISSPGMFGLAAKWVILAANETNPGLFRSDFSTFWFAEPKCTEI